MWKQINERGSFSECHFCTILDKCEADLVSNRMIRFFKILDLQEMRLYSFDPLIFLSITFLRIPIIMYSWHIIFFFKYICAANKYCITIVLRSYSGLPSVQHWTLSFNFYFKIRYIFSNLLKRFFRKLTFVKSPVHLSS